MKISLIIIIAYAIYYIGMFIYDAFIAKAKIANNGVDEAQSIVLEDHDVAIPEEGETRVVNFAAVDNSDSNDQVVSEEIQERSDEQVLLDARKKMEEERYFQDTSEEINTSEEDMDNSNSFILKFRELIQGSNQNPTSNEIIKNEVDVSDFIENATKISSFNYSQAQLF